MNKPRVQDPVEEIGAPISGERETGKGGHATSILAQIPQNSPLPSHAQDSSSSWRLVKEAQVVCSLLQL